MKNYDIFLQDLNECIAFANLQEKGTSLENIISLEKFFKGGIVDHFKRLAAFAPKVKEVLKDWIGKLDVPEELRIGKYWQFRREDGKLCCLYYAGYYEDYYDEEFGYHQMGLTNFDNFDDLLMVIFFATVVQNQGFPENSEELEYSLEETLPKNILEQLQEKYVGKEVDVWVEQYGEIFTIYYLHKSEYDHAPAAKYDKLKGKIVGVELGVDKIGYDNEEDIIIFTINLAEDRLVKIDYFLAYALKAIHI